jgi:tRNA dimethylallyltransferase
LISIAHPSEEYSVKKYIDDAVGFIDDIFNRGKTPIIVGGTGLYIDSLLSGRDFSSRNSDGLRAEIEAEYETKGGEFMLSVLSGFDPKSAEVLHPNDKKRIVRAVEVYKATGKTISCHNLETQLIPPRYEAVKIALMYSDRSILYDKINKRVEKMIEDGLEQEVRNLKKMSIPKNSTAMQAIGYKEMLKAIEGEISMGEAIKQIKQESRRYAKRQLTWLRRDKTVQWLVW